MIAALFLTAALAPAPMGFAHAGFTRGPIQAIRWLLSKNDEDKLVEWLRKNNPEAEVFIHENPQEDRLKKDFWERIPFTYNGKQIWIKKKPVTDTRRIETSA